jgi:hypothetical protein
MKAEDIKKTLEQAIDALSELRVNYIDPLVTAATEAVAFVHSKIFPENKEAIELTNFQDRHDEAKHLHLDELLEEDEKRKVENK